jgi:predicted dehydrogenase
MNRIRIGAIGAGGFGLFALQQFLQVKDVELVAIAGTHREAAIAMARRFGVAEPLEVDRLLQLDEVDLVYIATPPFLHYTQVRAALEAGKHVICEKPLALTVEQADDLLQLARDRDRLCIANLMQRYNPLFLAVRRLIESRVIGECLHGWFDNAAGDEGLSPEHWFWDRAKSGGIFIEHGVHFFDLFEGWLGRGQVVASQRVLRPGSALEEQVQCVVRYPNGALVTFYHGFTQPARLERQEFRLLFERGELTLDEWVPIRVHLRAVVDEAQSRTLMDIFPDATLDVLNTYSASERRARGRHKDFDVYQKIDLRSGMEAEKMRRYCELLRALFADQICWLKDRSHERVINEENGRNSLAMACAATQLADSSP